MMIILQLDDCLGHLFVWRNGQTAAFKTTVILHSKNRQKMTTQDCNFDVI